MPKKPKPFSSEWLEAPARPPERPRRVSNDVNRNLTSIAGRLPGERHLAMVVVLVLVIGSFWFTAPMGETMIPAASSDAATMLPTLTYEPVSGGAQPTVSTDALKVVDQGAIQPTQVASDQPSLNLSSQQAEANTAGGIFPEYRILSFYGFPGDSNMGILGQHSMDDLLDLLRDQAEAYEEADPTRKVKLAMEVVASVAQTEPQADGSYLLDAPASLLDTYADFAEENDILLILDVQVGRRTVQAEVEGLRPWLERPYVHLAIDPEFSMREGEIPGDHIGQIDGSDVTWTQNYLVQVATEAGISPKVLIVHQFLESMIENKDTISMVQGVQLVIDCDGFGPPSEKKSTYNVTNTSHPIEYNGLKLFYDQDRPLMTPEEVLEMDPSPDFIMYQ